MRLKSIGGVILVTLVLLVLIEAFCYSTLDDTPFLWDWPDRTAEIVDLKNGFDEVDPLLGYAKTESKLNKQGWKVEKGCVIIADDSDTTSAIRILVTGGSTSDLSLYPGMWPIELHKVLKAHSIHAKIYCAAVGGYHSGQELLKLIRDGVETSPVVHISYSGANDYATTSYICGYETEFYQNCFNRARDPLMPSTLALCRRVMRSKRSEVSLHADKGMPGADFWEKNMCLMNGVALQYHYKFIGCLQPVVGGSKSKHVIDGHEESQQEIKVRYPKMKEAAGRHPEFLADLTEIFDTCHGQVYIDHCHIHEEYQHLVAENIYNVLVQRGLLK